MNKSDKNKRALLPDEELIKRFQNHDQEVFQELIKRHMNTVFNLCCRIVGDYDDADDCAQDTFLKVYKNLAGFRFDSSFSTWIYRIAVNTCKNHLSSFNYRIRKKFLRIDSPQPTDSGSIARDIGDSGSNPETLFDRKMSQEMIQTAINSLPDEERILIVLRDIEGRSYEEVASIAGIKIGTVKSRISRARHSLRNSLKGAFQ